MSRIVVSPIVLVLLLGAGSFMARPAAAGGEAVAGEALAHEATAGPAAQAEGEGDEGASPLEGFSRIFASLGVYIVTMFTMAIGMEILVDVVKLGVGLKSKPTARQTLEEYERMLPGTLASLGIGAKARHNLEHQFAAMKELLEPAFQVEQAFANLRDESFKRTLEDLLGAEASEQEVAKASQMVKNQLRAAVNKVGDSLNLGDTITGPLLNRIVGVLLAYLLQIDSGALLGGLFPAGARFLTTQLIPESISLGVENNFQVQPLPLTAGIILTGLAAGAGSGFWHDQLGRLQTVQKRTEAAYTAVESLVVSKDREVNR